MTVHSTYKIIGFDTEFKEDFQNLEEAFAFRDKIKNMEILVKDSFKVYNDNYTQGMFTETINIKF